MCTKAADNRIPAEKMTPELKSSRFLDADKNTEPPIPMALIAGNRQRVRMCHSDASKPMMENVFVRKD
jgi:hypothetical protein